jgi:hypothetical protein
MSFGQDLKDFTASFQAGYQLMPSALDQKAKQAQIDQAKAGTEQSQASTENIRATTAAMPAKIASEAAMTRRNLASADLADARAQWFADGAPHTTIKGVADDGNEQFKNDILGVNPNNTPTMGVSHADGSQTGPMSNPNDIGIPPAPAAVDPPSPGEQPQAPEGAIPASPDVSNYAATSPTPTPAQTVPNSSPAAANAAYYGAGRDPAQPAHVPSVLNNSPGNIADGSWASKQPGYTGGKGGFAVFDTPEAGSAAMLKLLGNYTQQGNNTISSILNKWAPADGAGNAPGSTTNYITSVAKRTGIDPSQPLTPDQLPLVASAMSEVEAGIHPGGELQPLGGGTSAGNSAVSAANGVASTQPSAIPPAPLSNSPAAPAAPVVAADPTKPPPSPTDGAYTTGQMSAVGGAPVSKPAADQTGNRSAGSIDPTVLAQGIKMGQDALSNNFMPQGTGGVATNDQSAAVNSYHNGSGGNLNWLGVMRQKIDPKGTMSDGQVAELGIVQIVQAKTGSPQQKANAIGELLQTSRLASMQYAEMADKAAKGGDLDKTLAATAAAYNCLPNGKTVTHINFDQKSNMLYMDVQDTATGKITQQPLMSPQQVMAGGLKITPQHVDQILAETQAAGAGPQDPKALTPMGKAALDYIAKTGDYPSQYMSGTNAVDSARITAAFDAVYKSKAQSADNNSTLWGDFGSSVLSTATTALTTGGSENNNSPAFQATKDALANKGNASALTNSLIDMAKASRNTEVPTEVGSHISSLLVPGGYESYQRSVDSEGKVTFVNPQDQSTFSLPGPVDANIRNVLKDRAATVQQAEQAKLAGDSATKAADAANAARVSGGKSVQNPQPVKPGTVSPVAAPAPLAPIGAVGNHMVPRAPAGVTTMTPSRTPAKGALPISRKPDPPKYGDPYSAARPASITGR